MGAGDVRIIGFILSLAIMAVFLPEARPAVSGYRYEIVFQEGENPLARTDTQYLCTLRDQVAAGGNPNGVGPNPCDPLVSFVEPEDTTYPLAYERIAQIFESPLAGDLIFVPSPFGHGDPELPAGAPPTGNRGYLDAIQSRSVLILSGPGVHRGAVISVEAGTVDIAPTAAHLLGIAGRAGIGPDGMPREGLFLGRQDGRVLEEALSGGMRTYGAADSLILFILNGLNHALLLDALGLTGHFPGAPRPEIGALARLAGEGSVLQCGAVGNFPAYPYAGSVAIGTGAWSGRHGMANDRFYLRERREVFAPSRYLANVEPWLAEGVETLHEAVHRTFGPYGGEGRGALTAAINEPASRGADFYAWGGRWSGAGPAFHLLWPAIWFASLADSDPHWADDPDYLLESAIDALGEAHARALIMEGDGAPRYMGVSFALTDGAGFRYGPYSEGAAAALEDTDRRVGRILEAVEKAGRRDSTLCIVASSHGMELQDQTRSINVPLLLAEAGLKCEVTYGFIYLMCMTAAVNSDLLEGSTLPELVVTVADDDRGPEGGPLPLRAGAAEVTLINGDGRMFGPVRTDCQGRARFARFRPAGPAVTVRASHPAYNPLEMSLPVESVRSGGKEISQEQREGDQGINESEVDSAALAVDALLCHEGVDMVLAMRQDPEGRTVYEVSARRGRVQFIREQVGEDGSGGHASGGCGGCAAHGAGGSAPAGTLWLIAVVLAIVWMKRLLV